VELKIPAERTFAEVSAKQTEATAFRLYWPQVQHQLCVASAERGWLVFYGGPQRLLEFPVGARGLPGEQLVPSCLRSGRRSPGAGAAARPARDLYVPFGEELDHWSVLAGNTRTCCGKAGLDAA
jgi:hypothetical protein